MCDGIAANDFARPVIIEIRYLNEVKWISYRPCRICPVRVKVLSESKR